VFVVRRQSKVLITLGITAHNIHSSRGAESYSDLFEVVALLL